MNIEPFLPLKGCRIFILRSLEQASSLYDSLSKLGAEVISYPTLVFHPIEADIHKITQDFLAPIDTLIFTSVNGVRFFMQGLSKNCKMNLSLLLHKVIIAVGPKTAQFLDSFGLRATWVPKQFSAEGILEELPQQLHNQRILLAVALEANPLLKQQLSQRGAHVTVLNLYRTSAPMNYPPQQLENGDYVVFTSPSTVKHFFESPLWQGQLFTSLCMGSFTAQALQQKGQSSIVVSPHATLDSLIATLLNYRSKEP